MSCLSQRIGLGPLALVPLVAALLASTSAAQSGSTTAATSAAQAKSAAQSTPPDAQVRPTGAQTSPVAPPASIAPKDLTAQAESHPHECGLGAAFHAGRRKKLVELLRAQSPTGLVLVRGLPATREYMRFSQDKTFWYLTGVESPDAALVIDVKSGAATLFLPPRSATNERWEGELWDAQDAWVKDVTGFTDVRATNELVPMLKEEAAAAKVVWISKEPWVELSGCSDRASSYDSAIRQDPLDGRMSREDSLELNLQQKLGVDVRDCAPILAEMRRIKMPEEIAALRRAGRIGALAMEEAVRCSRPGRGEWELEAVMSFVQRREGATGPAYHAIVGCGPNALVMHYSEDSRTMRPGEMVLLDYAPEVDHYTSDITRSWPVDGYFTPRMIELYDAVLEAQLAGIAAVKPGASIEDVEKACQHVLSAHGLFKLRRHGVSHYVGMEVHDVGEFLRPLEPGVVLTVEPGVYDAQANIGVRIEDVVLVTTNGCEVLTSGVPKDRGSLVALHSEVGILDRKPEIEGLRGPIAVENPSKH